MQADSFFYLSEFFPPPPLTDSYFELLQHPLPAGRLCPLWAAVLLLFCAHRMSVYE